MLLSTATLPNTSFVFYDVKKQQTEEHNKRDSIMYENINVVLKKNPEAIFISISGRLHSLMKPTTYITPIGYYLKEQKGSVLKDAKILSIRHTYRGGTMYNATMDGGLEVRKADNDEAGFYASSTPFERYLLIMPEETEGFNAIYFTRKVTASTEWVKKK